MMTPKKSYPEYSAMYAQFITKTDGTVYLLALKRNPDVSIRISAVDYVQIINYEKNFGAMLALYDILLTKNCFCANKCGEKNAIITK